MAKLLFTSLYIRKLREDLQNYVCNISNREAWRERMKTKRIFR